MMAVGFAIAFLAMAVVYLTGGKPDPDRWCWRTWVGLALVVGILLVVASVVTWLWQVMP
jgi:hypothetical protein